MPKTYAPMLVAFNLFPGGVAALLEEVEMSKASLYRVSSGWHAPDEPWLLLAQLREAFESIGVADAENIRKLLGWRPWVAHELTAAWRRA